MIDLTEEEREFLLRTCIRAERFFRLYKLGYSSIDRFCEDLQKIRFLRDKLKKKS